ncbi:MAG: BACON domain-containing protein [Bacteroidales bacterium]
MQSKRFIALLMLTGAVASSVNSQDLKINHTSINVPTGINNLEIPLSSPYSCAVTTDQTWIEYDATRSSSNTIVLKATTNESITPRTARVRVTQKDGGTESKEIVVTQFGAPDLNIGYNPNLSEQSFPGAEGGGAIATGGRGGKVLYVTTLEDKTSNPPVGSLRWAVNQSGPRTILFKVSGIIELQSTLVIRNGDLTIAGQSAPGDGITIKDYTTRVNEGCDNLIIRFIRFRMGDEKQTEDDAIWGRNAKNIMLDHCTMSWNTDECSSFYDNRNFTMQWCILSESLRISVHDKGTHGYGGIWGGESASFHHNILAHHDSRNPRMNGTRYSYPDPDELVDFRNNVLFNWGANNAYAGEGGNYNFVNNYYQPGPASKNTGRIFQPTPSSASSTTPANVWANLYVDGNRVMSASGSVNSSVTNNNWNGIQPNPSSKDKAELKHDSEFAVASVTTHSAEMAYYKAIEFAGASFSRDTVDRRIAREVENIEVTYTNGGNGSTNGLIDTQEAAEGWALYRELYKISDALEDSDGDGIPDIWEEAYALNPNNSADGNLKSLDPSGRYTNLEVYLHNLVQHIVKGQLEGGEPSIPQSNRPVRLTTLRVVNPIQGDLLQMKCDEPLRRARLYSLTGTLIVDRAVEGTMPNIELPNISRGSYLLSVETESGLIETLKVVK